MKKNCIKFVVKTNDELVKGWHAVHPILPDDTLCCIAISDNEEGWDTENKYTEVTCKSCLRIIAFCKEK